jgi:hypothetical protein
MKFAIEIQSIVYPYYFHTIHENWISIFNGNNFGKNSSDITYLTACMYDTVPGINILPTS